jgi:hypothetical protein
MALTTLATASSILDSQAMALPAGMTEAEFGHYMRERSSSPPTSDTDDCSTASTRPTPYRRPHAEGKIGIESSAFKICVMDDEEVEAEFSIPLEYLKKYAYVISSALENSSLKPLHVDLKGLNPEAVQICLQCIAPVRLKTLPPGILELVPSDVDATGYELAY